MPATITPVSKQLFINLLDADLNLAGTAFAIDPSLLDFQQQFLPGPLFPPGQVKKALR